MNQEYIGPPRPPGEKCPDEPGRLWEEPRKPDGIQKLTYSVSEAAEALGISRPTLYKLLNREDFPAWRLGERWLISAELLAEWVRAQARGAFQ